MASRETRNAAVDSFRCLLMFLVVLHHAAAYGYYKDDTVCWSLPVFFTMLTFWHVDGFLAISGWFGLRFSLVRFAYIYGVIFFWSVVKAILLIVSQGKLQGSIWSGGWFGGTYLTFLFVVPLLNAALDKVVSLKRHEGYAIWGVFNAGIILNWAPFHLLSGVSALGGGPFSLLTFIYIYVNVRFIRLMQLDKYFTKKYFVIGVLIFLLGIVCFSLPYVIWLYLKKGAVSHLEWIGMTSYNSPHSLVMALSMLLLFVKFIRIPLWLSRLFVQISPLMFGVYIIQEGTGIGRYLFILPERVLAETTSLHPLLVVLLSAIFAFGVAIALDATRHISMMFLKKALNSRIKRLDEKLGLQ